MVELCCPIIVSCLVNILNIGLYTKQTVFSYKAWYVLIIPIPFAAAIKFKHLNPFLLFFSPRF